MALFSRQINFLRELELSVFDVLKDSINQNNGVIEDYVSEDQLFDRGVDGNNKKLRGYARTTIRIKSRKNQPTDRTTLRDTGKFHRSILVEGFPLALEVSSDVDYVQYLTRATNYGINILKPSNKNMTDFFDEFFVPDLKKNTLELLKK